MVWFHVALAAWAESDSAGKCRPKDEGGCLALGEAEVGRGDTRAARGAFEKACKVGPSGCGRAGELAVAMGDRADAVALFEKGCAGGDIPSCAGRAAIAFDDRAYEDAITWGSKGCVSEREIERIGTACRAVYAAADVTRRFDVALAAGMTACLLGDAQMCGMAYDTPHLTDAQRIEVLQKGCEQGGDAAMCYELGVQMSAGDLLPENEPEGARLITRACDSGYLQACERAEAVSASAR